MTVLVKHSDGDYRLHEGDGTQIGSGRSERPTQTGMADMLAEKYPGNSMLATDKARQIFTEIVAGEVGYRNLTMDGETVPWDSQS